MDMNISDSIRYVGVDDLDLEEVDGKNNTGDIYYNPNSEAQQKAIEEIMERGKVSR